MMMPLTGVVIITVANMAGTGDIMVARWLYGMRRGRGTEMIAITDMTATTDTTGVIAMTDTTGMTVMIMEDIMAMGKRTAITKRINRRQAEEPAFFW